MAVSNRDRVGKALDLLRDGLAPFVEREMQARHGADWRGKVSATFPSGRPPATLDVQALLAVVRECWTDVFSRKLSNEERTLVHELREVRNRWAHQQAFTFDDTYRALDSVARLLQAVGAEQQAALEREKHELLRLRFEEQSRQQLRRAGAVATEGQPREGLAPWREVVTPHPDVASGRYQEAEFAADLAQVARGEGGAEYRDPTEFFRRTFLTEGLRRLLVDAARRLAGHGDAPPVVGLQTNFGGGKTHSLLALYHLFGPPTPTPPPTGGGGVWGGGTSSLPPTDGAGAQGNTSPTPPSTGGGEARREGPSSPPPRSGGGARGGGLPALPGVEDVLREAGLLQPPRAHRAVLVGTAFNPAQPRRKPDGVETRTLWGELAWQLGDAAGDARGAYALVADADARGVSPGADTLQELFALLSPCLVLIDEWVAFARQLYGVAGLPAGSFDANLTFAQALTEAARRVPGALVVASIPASDIEVGGEAGREALARLENTFARIETSWRPATTEESFAIVRRRLFQPITDPALYAARDAVVEAFSQLYQTQRQEFPTGCGEAAYARRLRDAYPIHPELFDRLYEDWSTLERFQRTRGVLRLMAAVIHALWERQDRSLLILPGTVPLDDPGVQDELLRYLDDPWRPIIEADVDGPQSLPLQLDRSNPNLGRYSACRRVARTLYLGSAPTVRAAHRGLEEQQIKLGCVQPGESVATFGDALRRLTDQATHLYVDGRRYWYALQPSVTRLAEERAPQQAAEAVAEEIRRRLRTQAQKRGDFAGVHVCPTAPADVPDEREARLVILPPDAWHAGKAADSPARQRAAHLLEQRGTGPRLYRNMLVFLATDRARQAELEQAVRRYLAWKSIEADREVLNLDTFQAQQAETKRQQADETVDLRLPEAYQWLLVPTQRDPHGPIEWEERRLQGNDPLVVRASKRLQQDGLLLARLAGVPLRHELDRVPLWRGDHVGLQQLWEDFARYLYLPRLRDSSVLLAAVQDGVALLTWETDTFAYAQAWDEARGRYLGLRAGEQASVVLDGVSLLVRPEVARRQLDAEAAARTRTMADPSQGLSLHNSQDEQERHGGVRIAEAPPAPLTRFHGAVRLDPRRLGRDAGQVAEAVVQHLLARLDADVEVVLEIQARVPQGLPQDVIRVVSENCRTLRFTTFGFEPD